MFGYERQLLQPGQGLQHCNRVDCWVQFRDEYVQVGEASGTCSTKVNTVGNCQRLS